MANCLKMLSIKALKLIIDNLNQLLLGSNQYCFKCPLLTVAISTFYPDSVAIFTHVFQYKKISIFSYSNFLFLSLNSVLILNALHIQLVLLYSSKTQDFRLKADN